MSSSSPTIRVIASTSANLISIPFFYKSFIESVVNLDRSLYKVFESRLTSTKM